MNSRRVHELMLAHFPEFALANCEWVNVMDSTGPRVAVLRDLLEQHVGSAEALVEVHRKLGAFLPMEEAIRFLCQHIGEGQIRVANREFSGFLVVAQNGVATAWSRQADIHGVALGNP